MALDINEARKGNGMLKEELEEADWCMAHFMQSKVTVDSMVGKTVRKVSFNGRNMEISFMDESVVCVKALNGMCCWSSEDGEPEH